MVYNIINNFFNVLVSSSFKSIPRYTVLKLNIPLVKIFSFRWVFNFL